MRALILAAGRGSRLKHLTHDRPKCLVEVSGQPLLYWQLNALRQAGIEEIAIVRGYQAHQLNMPNVTFFDNLRWESSNMVTSLVCAAEWLRKDSTVVSYADIVYPSAIVTSLMEVHADIALTYDTHWLSLWQARFDDPLLDAETFQVDDRGQLCEIGNRAQTVQEIQGQYMGLMKLTPAGWQMIEARLSQVSTAEQDRLDVTALLKLLLQDNVPIQTVPMDDPWCEVDSERDLVVCSEVLKHF